MVSPDNYEITTNEPLETAAVFTLNGQEGSLRASMSDDYPPSSSGEAEITLQYGDTTIEAYSRDGSTPAIRIRNDNWGDTVDGYSGEPISDDDIEDWNDAAETLESATGTVTVYQGTEVFYQGQADWKNPRPSEERIEEGIDYDIRPSNTSRVETMTDDHADLEEIVATYEPDLQPLARSGILTTAWETYIEGYEDTDFDSF